MGRPDRSIAFVVDELGHDTPAQQLLDRFLIGYPRNGEFHQSVWRVHLWSSSKKSESEVNRRVTNFSLQQHDTLKGAVAHANGIIVVPKDISDTTLLASAIDSTPPSSPLFFYGAMAGSLNQARESSAKATARGLALCGGTSMSVTWRLPDVDVPRGARLTDALIIVQGEFPAAELHGLDGLLPLLENRSGGESGVQEVRLLQGVDTWKLLSETDPAGRLIAAALSRSDSPQGDPVRDGRTQNLLALGLVPRLATHPRAWLLDHGDGLRSTILVLDGVIADFNFAIRTTDGRIISAQLYRPPAPQRHEFSRLAHLIENFFLTRRSPWSINRSLLTRELLDGFDRSPASRR